MNKPETVFLPDRPISDFDQAAVSQSVRHSRLVAASRVLARIVKHADPPADIIAERTPLAQSLATWIKFPGGEAFDRPWSPGHLTVLEKLGKAVRRGGLFALAMPRGHGKTTIIKWSLLYVLLTGIRKYVVIVAATAELAQSMIEFVRAQLLESESLHEQYPNVTTYVRATGDKAIKARNQQI